MSLERAAQVGCVLAAYVVETVGTQEYTFTASRRSSPGSRAAEARSYGEDARRPRSRAADLHLSRLTPRRDASAQDRRRTR